MQSDIYESHCSPISSDHSASPLSELTSAEHILAISLAWCVISILSCCCGCCPVQHRDTCIRRGVVVTCHHASVIVPRSFDGSLWSLVTLPGWKQLVTMDGCMVHSGMKSSAGHSLCIIQHTTVFNISFLFYYYYFW